uniref:Uncharacterized protein n=1 Tax=Aegilops tauschii subsp. strangulata TaxID=200361 RepID=A0A453SMN9_AEGTS
YPTYPFSHSPMQVHVLRAANLAIELSIEQTISSGSRNVRLPNESDDTHLSIATSSIEQLVSGLEDYALSHGNTCDKCDACCMNRDRLKVGTGSAKNSDRRRDKGLLVEIAIMVAHTASDLSCWMVNCSSTQVLHFQDFVPCPISQSSFNVLMSMDWQSFGFKLKGGFMDDEGNAVLEWDNLTFARVDIAIHTYHGIYPALVLRILSFSIGCLGVDIQHGFFPIVFLQLSLTCFSYSTRMAEI